MIIGDSKRECAGIYVFDLNSYQFVMKKNFHFVFLYCKRIQNFIALDNNLILYTLDIYYKGSNVWLNNNFSSKYLLLIQYYFNNRKKS